MSSLETVEKKKPTSYCIRKRNIEKCIGSLRREECFTKNNVTTDENISFLDDILEEDKNLHSRNIVKKDVKTFTHYPVDYGISNRMKIISKKPFWWMNDFMEDGKITVPLQLYGMNCENSINIAGIKKSLTYYLFPNIAGVESFPRLYSEIKDFQLSNKKVNISNESFDQLLSQWYSCLDENISLWRMKKAISFFILTSSYTIYFGKDKKIILNGSTICCRKRLKEANISYDLPPSLAKLKSQLSDSDVEKNFLVDNNKKSKIDIDINEDSMKEIVIEEFNELKGSYPILIDSNSLENFVALLKDKSFVIPNYGIHCHLPPTIVSSEPFCNSTIKELTISSRIVKYPSKDCEYHIEINGGPLLPHVGLEIIKYLYSTSAKDKKITMEITFYGKDSYNGLNTFFEDAVNFSKICIDNVHENVFKVEC